MLSLAIGCVLVAAAVLACLPGLLGWWGDVLAVLRGSLPVLAVFFGLLAILIGIADIKDKRATLKEEQQGELKGNAQARSPSDGRPSGGADKPA